MDRKTIIPIGPYHPLQEEPEFFKLHVEGETVTKLDIEIGYNHRGIEKLSESKTFEETVFLVERICGICSTSHPMACVQAIEDAGDVEVPERALYIRTLVCEMERIHSHMLWLGLAGHFLGFNTIWMWSWRYREDLLDLFEMLTGNRNHYGMMKPGGVRRDIKDDDIPRILKLAGELRDAVCLFRDAVVDDIVLHARIKGVGVLPKQAAIDYCVLGPIARSCGIPIDVRKNHPHAAYGLVEWDMVVTDTCDVYGRAVVRILEMLQSIRIIEQCAERLKTVRGSIDSSPKQIKIGEGIGQYEAPRGECFHYIRSDGGNRAVRHKIRAPSYMNVPTNSVMVVGGQVSDAIITLGSVDPCYCCTERMAAIDSGSGVRLYSADDLLKMSREKTARIRREIGVGERKLDLDRKS